MYQLTSLQSDILYCIARMGGEGSGLDIADAVSNYRGKDYHLSQIYRRLKELSDDGLVRINDGDGSEKSYQLTRRARMELRLDSEWKAEMMGDLEAREVTVERS